jgi:hypothetical protein
MGRGRLLEIVRTFVKWRSLVRREPQIPANRPGDEPAYADF